MIDNEHPAGGMPLLFRRFAQRTAAAMGSSFSFLAALALIFAWVATGPVFHFSDTWQLVINTSTTIITFLMVFLIQNTQNRDSHALHLKLDELIRANRRARNKLLALEDLSDAEMRALQAEFELLRDRPSSQAVVKHAVAAVKRDSEEALNVVCDVKGTARGSATPHDS